MGFVVFIINYFRIVISKRDSCYSYIMRSIPSSRRISKCDINQFDKFLLCSNQNVLRIYHSNAIPFHTRLMGEIHLSKYIQNVHSFYIEDIGVLIVVQSRGIIEYAWIVSSLLLSMKTNSVNDPTSQTFGLDWKKLYDIPAETRNSIKAMYHHMVFFPTERRIGIFKDLGNFVLTEPIEAISKPITISTKKLNILTDISMLNNLVDIELEEIVGASSVSALTGLLVPNAGKTMSIPILIQTKCKLLTAKLNILCAFLSFIISSVRSHSL
jgi:hypothetical protein